MLSHTSTPAQQHHEHAREINDIQKIGLMKVSGEANNPYMKHPPERSECCGPYW